VFARLLHRGLWQRKTRALVALSALTVAATLTAALLNLHLDAQRKIRSEFSRYGANLMLTPRADRPAAVELLDAGLAERLREEFLPNRLTAVAPYLYAVVEVEGESVVLAGTWLDQFSRLGGFDLKAGSPPAPALGDAESPPAWVGVGVAQRLKLQPGDSLPVRYRDSQRSFRLAGVLSTGAAEDNQILADLDEVGALAGSAGRLNVILARANGEAAAVEQTAAELAARFPEAAVNPLRQVTQAEFHVVERIRGSLVGTTLVVLVVTSLCVLSTMTALAFERRRTVGTLKALGATEARLAGLFLGEAAVLAVVASGIGFFAGVALARWLGESLFAASVTLRWATLPLVTAATVAVALLGTLFPLRLVRRTQPAVILRGE
jgi:putative ABC transport system permease protein